MIRLPIWLGRISFYLVDFRKLKNQEEDPTNLWEIQTLKEEPNIILEIQR